MGVRKFIEKPLLLILTLMLAAMVCPAEGFVYYEQREAVISIIPQLQPSPYQTVIDLAGEWECTIGDRRHGNPVWIPGCYEQERETVTFRRNFPLDDSLSGLNFQLHIPELHYSAEIWINGRLLGSWQGSHQGFRCDIATDQLRFGTDNEIVLHLHNRLNPWSTFPVSPQLFQPANYGGVFSGIFLRGVPVWSLEDAVLDVADLNDSTVSASTVQIRLAQYAPLKNLSDSSTTVPEVRVYSLLRDSAGLVRTEGWSEPIVFRGSDTYRTTIDFPQYQVSLWSPTNPILYILQVYLIAGGDTLHTFTRPVGFKSVTIREGSIVLNGNPLSIHGIDYIPEFPQGRRAPAHSRLYNDLRRVRDLGMNVIRVPFGPPPPDLLNIADELGLLVLVEIGPSMTPGEVLAAPAYRTLLQKSVEKEITVVKTHPSLLGWGLGSLLNWQDSRTIDFSQWLYRETKSLDDHPCYIEISQTRIPDQTAEFVLSVWADTASQSRLVVSEDIPTIYSRIQRLAAYGERQFSETSSAVVNQAEYLLRSVRTIEQMPNADGYLLHAFADYHGASPTLLQPGRFDLSGYSFGIVNAERQERLVFAKLRDLVQTGQASLPLPIDTDGPPPLVFPVTGLVALLLISMELRRNNVFRHNVKRTFFHAHGFYSDLRYRRSVHSGQPILLWALEALTLGLLLASGLYYLRTNTALDYYLSQLFSCPDVKVWLVEIIWDPARATIYASLLFAAILLLKIVVIRLFSMLFHERMDLRQAGNYVVWSFVAFLFLLPVAIVFYRAIHLPTYSDLILIITGLGILWGGLRLINALRTGFAASAFRMITLMISTMVVLVVGIIFWLEHQYGTVTYLRLFHDVFGRL